MSIYTVVEPTQLETYLEQYSIGTLVSFQGIEAGVENTNYFVTTSEGEYVLTLVESVSADKLPFILGFVAHLAECQLDVAQPILNNQGELFGSLNDRPAVFMRRLNGGPLDTPNLTQCAVIGDTLAHSHQAASQLAADEYTHLYQWCSEVSARVLPKLDDTDKQLLQEAVMDAGMLPWTNLPTGPIHADLFPDNALFNGDALAGLIDFYHACSAPYLYDLAVTLNAWCYDEPTQTYDREKAATLLSSYQAIRTLDEEEHKWLHEMQKVAALRFWLSRLRDKLFPKDGELITVKDPNGKKGLLELLSRA
ncbi:homoserine kinase [Pontibacterium granulatum]|uniref:homoserine kinase n=1 Tax=Pontibacterium granulatum TaxID=2036029 RepID=UPI00249C4295|nr:homoserine kinase [Pontibacterium granulatum]MDI3325465.1 homoserine kinase [Pontibacterium granulatum]